MSKFMTVADGWTEDVLLLGHYYAYYRIRGRSHMMSALNITEYDMF